jgi:DNA-binding transcriptional MerR regulator
MPRRDSLEGPAYKVGELARRAGVTVRTLHHYESIDLLVPSKRTATGHRLYGAADVARLARIQALTALGFALEEVRRVLDQESPSPLALVERHLARAKELLEEQHALCARLETLREHLAREGDDVERLIETVEVMTMIHRYYTKEQLETLAQRREDLGEEAIRQVENDWQALFADVRALVDRGVSPDAPEALALARRWKALTESTVAGFTGGDPSIKASLDRLYREEPVEKIHPSFDPAVFAFMNEACKKLE